MRAHYTNDLATITAFGKHYGVRYWLVNKAAFSPDYLNHHRYWANNYPSLTQTAVTKVRQPHPSVLQTRIQTCTVVETERFWLADHSCIVNQPVVTAP